jgi:hypothetical protein
MGGDRPCRQNNINATEGAVAPSAVGAGSTFVDDYFWMQVSAVSFVHPNQSIK